ncbi:lamin tail domain-containing protein [Olivibacter sp. SDN3]|uniref:lamin tail domain-containing protein n=1 Tax=Olivibacter sp. SDN3 TaxID=2764720 RepID=UPI001650E330|nr:lamin tail domain-containing protein [Olivibacter sp. SDN3]QNL50821.1 lamin tail domain-containing protein [Olivibacter sp. SDN3]
MPYTYTFIQRQSNSTIWRDKTFAISNTFNDQNKLLPDSSGNYIFSEFFSSTGLDEFWQGNTSNFTIVNERLQISGEHVSPVTLTTPNKRIRNTIWETGIQIDGNLSSTNNIRIYLACSESNMQSHLGYHLQIDGSGAQHTYQLWRQNGSSRRKIFQSIPLENKQTSLRVRLKINCDQNGLWNIYADEYDEGIYKALIDDQGLQNVLDSTYSSSTQMGMLINYSITRRADYKIDYLLSRRLDENLSSEMLPLKVVSYKPLTSNTFQLIFNKPINPYGISLTDFVIADNYRSPENVKVDKSEIILTFEEPFEPGDYTLQLHNFYDIYGNATSEDSVIFHYEEPHQLQQFDIVINEIMARPHPSNGLPATEYIELFNRSDKNIALTGMTYKSLATSYTFNKGVINAGEHLILCRSRDTSTWKNFGKTIGLSPWPVPTNAGTTLSLISEEGLIIDEVSYRESWHSSTDKRAGGWSLERIDYQTPCLVETNWASAEHRLGGTPGTINSIYHPLSDELDILDIQVIEEKTIALQFNMQIDTLFAKQTDLYQINHNLSRPDEIHIIGVNTVHLSFSEPLPKGLTYQLTLKGISDCSGELTNLTKTFYIAEDILPGDMLINEVLPNPRNEGVPFIELYNNSKKSLELKNLQLARIVSSDSIITPREITAFPHQVLPGTYKVLTIDPEKVKQQYTTPNEDAFVTMQALPQMNNRSGGIALLSQGKVIDLLLYNEKMHDPFIKDPKGVSLERKRFSVSTNEPGNFTSAAAIVGFATPGYQNSQYAEQEKAEDHEVWLTSKTFSPDYDGFEDKLEINYRFKEGGYRANIRIFNDRGQLIKNLLFNQSLATEGCILWDGLNDRNQLVPVGIYIIHLEIFNAIDSVKHYRISCVLADRF